MVKRMAQRGGSDHQTGGDLLSPEVIGNPVEARRRAREKEAARRARRWYHARWIAINLVLVGASAWLCVHVLILRFITKELTSQAAVLVHADFEGSAPSAGPVAPLEHVPAGAKPREEPDHRRSRRELHGRPNPAHADSVTIKELGAQCVGGRVFRKTVTNGVTEIDEVTGLRC